MVPVCVRACMRVVVFIVSPDVITVLLLQISCHPHLFLIHPISSHRSILSADRLTYCKILFHKMLVIRELLCVSNYCTVCSM